MFLVRSGAPVRTLTLFVASVSILGLFAPAASAKTHHHHHLRQVRHEQAVSRLDVERRDRLALLSRGITDTRIPATQVVVGRLGVVTDDATPINAGREQYGRLLSQVDKGTNLTITGESGDYYAVMMIDRSIGFVAKSKVQLLDYQVTANQTLPSGDQAGPLGQALIQTAVQYLGVPYVYGGDTTSGIDCSAFVQSVYSASGITLPRTAHEQANVGIPISTTDVTQWIPGDRIYFQCHHDYIDHAGMYIGNGYFIQSSIDKHEVNVTRIDNPYYWSHIVTVRRSTELSADNATVATNGVRAADSEASQN